MVLLQLVVLLLLLVVVVGLQLAIEVVVGVLVGLVLDVLLGVLLRVVLHLEVLLLLLLVQVGRIADLHRVRLVVFLLDRPLTLLQRRPPEDLILRLPGDHVVVVDVEAVLHLRPRQLLDVE